MEWIVRICRFPFCFLEWALKVVLWIGGIIIVAFLSLLFGPLSSEWHKRRK